MGENAQAVFIGHKLTLWEWVNERMLNCKRMAAMTRGMEQAGWLEDADYFRQILDRLD